VGNPELEGMANLTLLGLSAHQQVVVGVVQEIDIKTGKLLFQWVSSDHVPYSDSHAPMPQPGQPWDWFHINAVHLDTDGNLLISSRFTWTIYKVNLRTGTIMWQLGGKHSTFAVKAAPGQKLDSADEIFAFQHDPEALGGNVYTVFDDESARPESCCSTPVSQSTRLILPKPISRLRATEVAHRVR
jgi:outer membrane protein assembly factor BamB